MNIEKPKIKIKLKIKPTLKDNSLKPFWKPKTAQLSQLFWSPTLDHCVNLKTPIPINSWTSSLIQKHIDSSTIDPSIPLIHLLPADPPIEGKIIVRKIRIFPSINDKIKLKKIFGACRYIYNRGIDLIEEERRQFLITHQKLEGTLLQRLRTRLVHNHNYQEDDLQWMLSDLPSDSRDSIIKELNTNFWNAISTKQHFELKKRSKKNSQSMNIRLRDYHSQKGFYAFLRLMDKAELFPETEYDLKVHIDKEGKYYLFVSYDLTQNLHKLKKSKKTKRKLKLKHQKKKRKHQKHQTEELSEQPMVLGGESQTPKTSERSLSGDPGLRTFLTCYTPDGYIYHIGLNDIQALYRLFYYKNRLQGKISKSTGRHKRKMKQAFIRLSERIHNLVDDFHKKTAIWLLRNFTTIIIPKLNVNSFNKKKTTRMTRNKMRLWRHCSFIELLKNKQRAYRESRLIIPTEEYTSKTCSNCGCLHPTLGTNKTFVCPNKECHRIFDRDVNASKNILLKTMTETTSVVL